MYIVTKQFRDVDGRLKVEGQIVEIDDFRAPKLISSGFIVAVSQEPIQSLLKIINDKIGNSNQAWNFTGDTVLGYANVAYAHIHNPAFCYPTLANGIQINTGAGDWELGSFAEIIPADEINKAFDIHWVNFEGASSNGVYELVLYSGASGSEVEIGRVRTVREGAQTGIARVPMQIPVQAPNARISAKVASNLGSRNVTVSVFLHDYY